MANITATPYSDVKVGDIILVTMEVINMDDDGTMEVCSRDGNVDPFWIDEEEYRGTETKRVEKGSQFEVTPSLVWEVIAVHGSQVFVFKTGNEQATDILTLGRLSLFKRIK